LRYPAASWYDPSSGTDSLTGAWAAIISPGGGNGSPGVPEGRIGRTLRRQGVLAMGRWIGPSVFWALPLTRSQDAQAQSLSIPFEESERASHHAESLVITPDGHWLVTAGHVYDPKAAKSAGEIRLWDVTAAEVKKTLHGKAHSYSLRAGCLALSPDGKLL